MNEIPKIVLEHPAACRLARGTNRPRRSERTDLAPQARTRKDLIAYDGSTFDHALSRLGLVDEYRLMIQPPALGAGLALFKDLTAPLQIELVEATTYATGVAIHVCRPGTSPQINR